MRTRTELTFFLLLALPLHVSAQSTNTTDQTELIQQLWSRIETLERRVSELEGLPRSANPVAIQTVALASPATPAAAHPETAMPNYQAGEQQPAADAGAQPSYPSLKMAGFSDFNFSATDRNPLTLQRNARSGFTEGQFVLHLTSALSSKVNYFAELSASARTDAGTGSPAVTGFNFEMERTFIRFDQSDHFKASFGRYHTPINWWNTAYHHGQWLQTTISRPEMTQFGGRFIPVHFVGAMVEGTVPSGSLNLNYNAGFGNGRGSVINRGGDAGDNNNNRAWLVNLFAKPDAWFGLQVGGSVYRDKITLAGQEFREWITSGHVVWQKEDPEIIAEFANVNHQAVDRDTSFNSQAYYIQVGYRLPWFEKLWKPYYRFEYIHIPQTDPIFLPPLVPTLAGSVVGLRYDISSFAAIKAEYRNLRRLPDPQPRVNGGFVQTSFTF